MPCRNKDCELNQARFKASEADLVAATIARLQRFRVPAELAEQLGTTQGCVACACHQIAGWLDKYHKILKANYM